jgi:hypothetical protein
MVEEWAKWKDTTEKAMEEAGTSSETFTEDITSDMEEIGEATEDLAGTIDEQVEHMITYMGDLMDAVQEWRDMYLDAINAIISANESLAISQEEAAAAFDKNTDYSALMNEYLNKGGKVGDATYNEL